MIETKTETGLVYKFLIFLDRNSLGDVSAQWGGRLRACGSNQSLSKSKRDPTGLVVGKRSARCKTWRSKRRTIWTITLDNWFLGHFESREGASDLITTSLNHVSDISGLLLIWPGWGTVPHLSAIPAVHRLPTSSSNWIFELVTASNWIDQRSSLLGDSFHVEKTPANRKLNQKLQKASRCSKP